MLPPACGQEGEAAEADENTLLADPYRCRGDIIANVEMDQTLGPDTTVIFRQSASMSKSRRLQINVTVDFDIRNDIVLRLTEKFLTRLAPGTRPASIGAVLARAVFSAERREQPRAAASSSEQPRGLAPANLRVGRPAAHA